MRIIYEAPDGKKFYNEADCADYERDVVNRVNQIMSALPPKPKLDGGFAFFQHDVEVARKARLELLKMALEYASHKKSIESSIDNESLHPSWVGQIIAEMDMPALRRAWYRFECMKKYREYSQPYYAYPQ